MGDRELRFLVDRTRAPLFTLARRVRWPAFGGQRPMADRMRSTISPGGPIDTRLDRAGRGFEQRELTCKELVVREVAAPTAQPRA